MASKDSNKRVLIVGGVAGGASCAARYRRLCERCDIVVFDRGPYVSFANCGLPYYVGDVIEEEKALLVATPRLFKDRFRIEVCTETEIRSIDRDKQRILAKSLRSGEERWESYDALVLAPGAGALRPPLPGIDLPGVHVLRTIPDSRRIRAAVEEASSAVVVGGGFIGLEMAENLRRRGLGVSVVEAAPQLMPPLDEEMAAFVSATVRENSIDLHLGAAVESFEQLPGGGVRVATSEGVRLDADLVILAIGVRPETGLARDAGLPIGERGGILVDQDMRTEDPAIWAVGDAVEVRDFVTGAAMLMPLAGPANRQGRIAAGSILGALLGERRKQLKPMAFRGVQGTAVCGLFGLTVAMTGASEKSLLRASVADYGKVYLHPGNHVGYYPGAEPIHMKLLFSKVDGKVLGAQAVGGAGTERRIDVIAMALQMGATVFDLEESELCYAPQFGAAKDPVNIAGMIAANHLRGDLPLADWDRLGEPGITVVDVRTEEEFVRGHIPGSRNVPLEQIRGRLGELPRDGEIWLVCGVGQRAYYATRVLLQNDFKVKNLSGGYVSYQAFMEARH